VITNESGGRGCSVEADFTAWKDKLLQSLAGAGGDGESASATNTTAAAAPAAAAPAAQPPKAEPEKPSVQIRVLDRSAVTASTHQRYANLTTFGPLERRNGGKLTGSPAAGLVCCVETGIRRSRSRS
jgi:hypothetical protein